MAAMTSMTRDVCPSCGAWLILVEIMYVGPQSRRYPEVGSLAVYECPSCAGLYETWAADEDPLEEMPAERRQLHNIVTSRRPREEA